MRTISFIVEKTTPSTPLVEDFFKLQPTGGCSNTWNHNSQQSVGSGAPQLSACVTPFMEESYVVMGYPPIGLKEENGRNFFVGKKHFYRIYSTLFKGGAR
jgi:hypothetical protein